jgi:hypothetical protein
MRRIRLGHLYDHLVQKFPRSRIFMDIDNLDPGEDFAQAIAKNAGSCDIFLQRGYFEMPSI